MKFLVDMPLSPGLIHWLQAQGHDAAHASALSLSQASDAVILRVAAEQGRVVVTADLDFPRLFALMRVESPGLILLRGGNYSEADSLDRLRRVLISVPQDELAKSIVVVDRERIRRRWLPI